MHRMRPKENIKGRNLWIDAQQEGLTLVTDPLFPTRIGNRISKDTFPDLTFTKNIIETYWLNTHVNMGSDHYIIETTFKAGPRKREGRALKMVEWDSFRKMREREASDAIEDLDEWLEKLKQNILMATKTISKTEGLENTDSKLLHMWEAKKSLEKRWKKQKHNKSLRKEIVTLSKNIEKYAEQLCRQQWEEKCDAMEKQIRFSKTWNLLRCLIDLDASKTAQRQNLSTLLHKYKGTEEELIQEIKQRYIGNTTKEQLSPY